jgi:hypothetical protein
MARDPLDEILSAPEDREDPLDFILNAPDTAPGEGGSDLRRPPTAGFSPGEPGAPSIPPQFGGNIVEAIKWAAQNPQMALDMAGQGVFGSLGIAGGTTVGGPVGGVAGGAIGNVAGKQAARTLGGYLGFPDSERPDLMSAETAVDAGLGATGPVLNKVAQHGSRFISGLSRKGVTEAEKKGAEEVATIRGHARDFKAAVDKKYSENTDLFGEMGASKAQFVNLKEATYGTGSANAAKLAQFQSNVDEAIKATRDLTAVKVEQAVRASLKKAQEGAKATDLALPAGIGALVSSLEPLTGALIGAGVGKLAIEKGLPKLLGHPELGKKFARWALDVESGKLPAGQIATSFTAMLAASGLDLDFSEDAPPRESSRPKPLRDERGRFKSVEYPELIDEILRGR